MQEYLDLVLCQLVDDNTNWVYQVKARSNFEIGDKVIVESMTNSSKMEKAIVVAIYRGAALGTPAVNFILEMLGYQDQSKLKTIVGKFSESVSFERTKISLDGIEMEEY